MPGVNLLDAAAVARRPAIFGECFTHNAVDLDDPAAGLTLPLGHRDGLEADRARSRAMSATGLSSCST